MFEILSHQLEPVRWSSGFIFHQQMSYFGFEPVSHTTSLTPTTTMPGHPPQLQENQSQPIFPAAGETQGSGTGDCPDSSDLIQELTERLRQLQIENGELK